MLASPSPNKKLHSNARTWLGQIGLEEKQTQRFNTIIKNQIYFGGCHITIIHSFYIALVSALKQTHCAHVTCGSEWENVSFYSTYY